MELGNILKSLRVEKGLKQEELAEKFGISRAAISYWESGITTPSIETLYELAKFYNVSVDYLVGIAPRNEDYEILLRFSKLSEDEKEKALKSLDFIIETFIQK